MRLVNLPILAALTTLAILTNGAGTANAGLLTGSVVITNDDPNLSTVVNSVGPFSTTTPGINLTGFIFSFKDDMITYTNPFSGAYDNAAFAGFVLTFTGIPTITDVTNDPTSQLDPGISFTGNTIDLNFAGLPRVANEVSVFDVQFQSSAVPEPATLALFGIGLAALGLIGRWRAI